MSNPGFAEFLEDASLSGDSTEEELDFLKSLKLAGSAPRPLIITARCKLSATPYIFGRRSRATQLPRCSMSPGWRRFAAKETR